MQMHSCITIGEVRQLKTLVTAIGLDSVPGRHGYNQAVYVRACMHGDILTSSIEQLPTGTSNSYKKSTPFVIDLNNALDEDDVSACDLGWFTVWSQGTQEHFTRIQIPMDIFVR